VWDGLDRWLALQYAAVAAETIAAPEYRDLDVEFGPSSFGPSLSDTTVEGRVAELKRRLAEFLDRGAAA
jgi:hypothetical protein